MSKLSEAVERVAEIIAPHLRQSYFNPDTDDQAEARGFAINLADKILAALTIDEEKIAVGVIEKHIRHFDRCIAKAVEDDNQMAISNLLAGQDALRAVIRTIQGGEAE